MPVVPRTALAAADLAAAVPSAATSFAGHHVLASLFPSRQQSLPPFLDGVVALHLTDARFGISSLSATPEQLTSSQTVGTFVARVLLASKLADGWSLLKTYSFNQTAAATALPPLLQYRPTGIYPQAFNPLPTGLSNSPAAFVYQQLQSVIPLVAAAGKDWVTKRNLKVLGVADPSLVSPFWTQPITGSVYPNTLPASDANAVLGLWFNVSASSNSTAAPNWAGYNFSTAAYLYPDPLYDPVIKAQLQAAIGAVGLAPNPYYGDLNQVRWLGQKNSVYRTKAQTNLAYFWRLGGGTATVPGAFSAIATQLLQANATGSASGVDLYASAALFARLHAAVWDGSVAGWTAKYKFLQWRPETALRYGDNSSLTFNTTSYLSKKPNWPGELTPVFAQPSISTDGTFTPLYNATGVAAGATSGPATDITGAKRQLHSAWSPELTSPGHPEYPSTHSVACKAAVTTLRLFFGTDSVATINNGAVLPLNSEDTYLGNGAGPGDGGRAWMQSATNATNLLTFLNLTGVAGAGNALDTAPFIYSLPLGLSPITYSTLSQMSRDCSDSRVYGSARSRAHTQSPAPSPALRSTMRWAQPRPSPYWWWRCSWASSCSSHPPCRCCTTSQATPFRRWSSSRSPICWTLNTCSRWWCTTARTRSSGSLPLWRCCS